MIHTQLLLSQPPYQIIYAGGEVGIQVATLVVVEDKTDANGNYAVETHSHPVVNYGLKENLSAIAEKNKKKAEFLMMWQLLPEGAVWDKVEIADVNVLGLAGITEDISLEEFINIIPKRGGNILPDTWSSKSLNAMHDIIEKLRHVGIKPRRAEKTDEAEVTISVMANTEDYDVPVVNVSLGEMDMFTYPLYNDKHIGVNECAVSLSFIINSISIYFFPPLTNFKLENNTFINSVGDKSQLEKDMEKLVGMVNNILSHHNNQEEVDI